jgi:hypothetical protein
MRKTSIVFLLLLNIQVLFSQTPVYIDEIDKIPFSQRVTASSNKNNTIFMVLDYPYEHKLTLLKIDEKRGEIIGRNDGLSYDGSMTMKYWLCDKYFILHLSTNLFIFDFDTLVQSKVRTLQNPADVGSFVKKSGVSYVVVDDSGVYYSTENNIYQISLPGKGDSKQLVSLKSGSEFIQFTLIPRVSDVSKPADLLEYEEKITTLDKNLNSLTYSNREYSSGWNKLFSSAPIDIDMDMIDDNKCNETAAQIFNTDLTSLISAYYLELAFRGQKPPSYLPLPAGNQNPPWNDRLADSYRTAKRALTDYEDQLDTDITSSNGFESVKKKLFERYCAPDNDIDKRVVRITDLSSAAGADYKDLEANYTKQKKEQFNRVVAGFFAQREPVKYKDLDTSNYDKLMEAWKKYNEHLQYQETFVRDEDLKNIQNLIRFKNTHNITKDKDEDTFIRGLEKESNGTLTADDEDFLKSKHKLIQTLVTWFDELNNNTVPAGINPADKEIVDRLRLDQLKLFAPKIAEGKNAVNQRIRKALETNSIEFVNYYDYIIGEINALAANEVSEFYGLLSFNPNKDVTDKNAAEFKDENAKTVLFDRIKGYIKKQADLVKAEKALRQTVFYRVIYHINGKLQNEFNQRNPYKNETQNNFLYYYKTLLAKGETYGIGIQGFETSLRDAQYGSGSGRVKFSDYLERSPITISYLSALFFENNLHKISGQTNTPFIKITAGDFLCLINGDIFRFSFDTEKRIWIMKKQPDDKYITMYESDNGILYALKDFSPNTSSLGNKELKLVRLEIGEDTIKELPVGRDNTIEPGSYISIVKKSGDSDAVFVIPPNDKPKYINAGSQKRDRVFIPVQLRGSEKYIRLTLSEDGDCFTSETTIEPTANFIR